jgi:hypothetical protein
MKGGATVAYRVGDIVVVRDTGEVGRVVHVPVKLVDPRYRYVTVVFERDFAWLAWPICVRKLALYVDPGALIV